MGRQGKEKQKTALRNVLFFLGILILCISIYFYWENNHIVISKSYYTSCKIPDSFDGYTIAQISDLHNKQFGKNQEYILKKLEAVKPNIIVITGDLVDRRKYDLKEAVTFVTGASKIAPVYYVSGNHEAWLKEFSLAKAQLIEAGAIFMDDNEVKLTIGGSSIKIFGVSDPDFLTTEYSQGNDVTKMTKQLAKWREDETFKILLTHRPELFDLYAQNNMDLIFAGHTHGGQIRIPFVGGIVAPDQGWFPEYTSGMYTQDASTMYVSRGLGNSIFPIRINDSPEILVVCLKAQEQ